MEGSITHCQVHARHLQVSTVVEMLHMQIVTTCGGPKKKIISH